MLWFFPAFRKIASIKLQLNNRIWANDSSLQYLHVRKAKTRILAPWNGFIHRLKLSITSCGLIGLALVLIWTGDLPVWPFLSLPANIPLLGTDLVLAEILRLCVDCVLSVLSREMSTSSIKSGSSSKFVSTAWSDLAEDSWTLDRFGDRSSTLVRFSCSVIFSLIPGFTTQVYVSVFKKIYFVCMLN